MQDDTRWKRMPFPVQDWMSRAVYRIMTPAQAGVFASLCASQFFYGNLPQSREEVMAFLWRDTDPTDVDKVLHQFFPVCDDGRRRNVNVWERTPTNHRFYGNGFTGLPSRQVDKRPPRFPTRKGLRPKVRFAVLERDGFACHYCGQRAPDVVLDVDHIVPVSRGGGDEPENLITSCAECNIGKGTKLLGGSA